MSRLLIISALLLTSFTCANAELVIFGSGANQFTMEFAEVGNPGNPSAAYLTWARSVGEVDHHYRIGKYEVSRDQFEKLVLDCRWQTYHLTGATILENQLLE